MADVVIDVTSYSVDAVKQAINLARRGGKAVLAGTKGPKPVPDFLSDQVVFKELTIIGALGVDYANYERAIRLIESRKYPLERLHTHTLPLTEAERAIRILARDEAGRRGDPHRARAVRPTARHYVHPWTDALARVYLALTRQCSLSDVIRCAATRHDPLSRADPLQPFKLTAKTKRGPWTKQLRSRITPAWQKPSR